MDQSTDGGILYSLSRENSEEFGAGEVLPDVAELSSLEDDEEDSNVKKPEFVKDKVPASKWLNFTRVLRLGLAASSNPDMLNMPSGHMDPITTHSKRGSLGKFFRHRFIHKDPDIENNLGNNAAVLQNDSMQQNKRGSLGKIFRHLKSSQAECSETNEPGNDTESEDKGETRKHKMGKIFRQKLNPEKGRSRTEDILPNTEPIYSDVCVVPNPEQKGRSLGKMFRIKHDNYVSK